MVLWLVVGSLSRGEELLGCVCRLQLVIPVSRLLRELAVDSIGEDVILRRPGLDRSGCLPLLIR